MERENDHPRRRARNSHLRQWLICLLLISGCRKGTAMNKSQTRSFEALTDPARPVAARLAAARSLGEPSDPQVAAALVAFLQRQRPSVPPTPDDDPLAAERCCDIVVVESLHRQGDDTQWARLLEAVGESGSGWGQPIRETDLAAAAIRRIGAPSLIGDLVALGEEGPPRSAINAVKTLAALELPEPATHQALDDIDEFGRPIEVKPFMFAAYVQQVVAASGGRLVLTEAVRAQLKDQDYQVSEGQTEETTVGRFLREELALYALAYYREDRGVAICTYPEAVARWHRWWSERGSRLVHREDPSRFVLRDSE
jgi:hypothetical protein